LGGWLDFKQKTPFSRLREDFILQHLERRMFKEVTGSRAEISASLLSAVAAGLKSSAFSTVFDRVEEYEGFALPWLFSRDKVDKSKKDNKISPVEELAYWKNVLAEREKRHEEAAKKREATLEETKKALEELEKTRKLIEQAKKQGVKPLTLDVLKSAEF
jgi:hypothetical protein